MLVLQIIAVLLIVVLIGHQIYALIRDLMARAKKPPSDNKDNQK